MSDLELALKKHPESFEVSAEGCWLWIKAKDRLGYGRLGGWNRGLSTYAHRRIYAVATWSNRTRPRPRSSLSGSPLRKP